MSYESQSLGAVKGASDLDYAHPWPAVILLAKAVVLALLSIAASIEGLHRR